MSSNLHIIRAHLWFICNWTKVFCIYLFKQILFGHLTDLYILFNTAVSRVLKSFFFCFFCFSLTTIVHVKKPNTCIKCLGLKKIYRRPESAGQTLISSFKSNPSSGPSGSVCLQFQGRSADLFEPLIRWGGTFGWVADPLCCTVSGHTDLHVGGPLTANRCRRR